MNIDFNKYFDLSSFTKEQQQAFINAMTELILVRLSDMVGDHLSDQEVAELENLSEKNDQQGLLEWLNLHIPNISQGIDEVLAEESASIANQVKLLNQLASSE